MCRDSGVLTPSWHVLNEPCFLGQPGGIRSRPVCWSLAPWLAAGGETTQAAQLDQQKTSWEKCVLLLERPRCSLEVGGAHALHKAAPHVPLPLAAGSELLQRLEIWVEAPTGSQVVGCCSLLFFSNLSVR